MKPVEQLLEENKNLIYSIAKSFNGDIEDLYQVGVLGFIRAYQNYRVNEFVKFTTYAYPYIWGEMVKFQRENKPLKVSKEISSLNSKIERAYNFLSQQLMKEPTTLELALYLEIPESFVVDAINSRNVPQSLDGVVGIDEMPIYEVIESSESIPIDSLLELKRALTRLDSAEKRLIEQRYLEDKTQTELSNSYGFNQVWISRQEQKILQKLKTYMQ